MGGRINCKDALQSTDTETGDWQGLDLKENVSDS